jgi:hypothetical protein
MLYTRQELGTSKVGSLDGLKMCRELLASLT